MNVLDCLFVNDVHCTVVVPYRVRVVFVVYTLSRDTTFKGIKPAHLCQCWSLSVCQQSDGLATVDRVVVKGTF